jgi:hypothetical protein
MKKLWIAITFSIALCTVMSSCYSHKFMIGEGPQTGAMVTQKNSFFLYGLIPGKVSDPQGMAGGAANFEVTEVQTFVDGLIGVLTLGIYTPTTTKVQK